MPQEFQFTVLEGDDGSRLDKLVIKHFPADPPSRSRIVSWIKEGRILVDGSSCRKPSLRLAGNQRVVVRIPVTEDVLMPVKGELEEVYKDDQILVLNKQAGISVHPAPSLNEPTLVNYLLERYPQLKMNFSGDRPGIVHRLDRDTSGLMVVALDEHSARILSRSFHDREVGKVYLAVIEGCPVRNQEELDYSLGRDPRTKIKMAAVRHGRPARTKYRVEYCSIEKKWSLVRLEILTGRTHQIRAHMAETGHPVLGDGLYGGKIKPLWGFKQRILSKLIKRQLLHSARLDFIHPGTGKRLNFFKAPPRDFMQACLYMDRKTQRVAVTGSMGSGKSTVISMLEDMGYPVFVADRCVKELYEPGKDGWKIIRDRFGDRFIDNEDQPVNKAGLAGAVAQDSGMLSELGHLIHPLVRHRLDEFWKEHLNRRVAFAEIPLLFETGMDSCCDLVVGLFCPEKVRFERLSRDRKLSSARLELMNRSQMSQASKINRCSLVLDNSSNRDDLLRRVESLTGVLRLLRVKEALKGLTFFKSLFEQDQQPPAGTK